jgi:S-adenosylmethionine:tRNA ribosyltransferase-isomerase
VTLHIEEMRYTLVPENIEGTPREFRFGQRDLGRMVVCARGEGGIEDSHVRDLPSRLRPGDVLVLNNSKRIPGVLRGRTGRGGLIELRFVDISDDGFGLCKVFPMHDVEPGGFVTTLAGHRVRILETGLTKYGLAKVAGVDRNIRALLCEEGEPILGFFYNQKWGTDCLNPYYASVEGSVESPLAGLHFTPELVSALQDRGVRVEFVTLHSVGSWLPFLEDDVEDHEMWAEWFEVPAATADAVNEAKRAGGRIVACGSTSLRALESASAADGSVRATQNRTSLYITPGYRFRCVSAYFTNFHQYQTSLMVLDAAFAGSDQVRRCYRYASEQHYSFYEFGDAVLYL